MRVLGQVRADRRSESKDSSTRQYEFGDGLGRRTPAEVIVWKNQNLERQ